MSGWGSLFIGIGVAAFIARSRSKAAGAVER
jgi:hypothetical protein